MAKSLPVEHSEARVDRDHRHLAQAHVWVRVRVRTRVPARAHELVPVCLRARVGAYLFAGVGVARGVRSGQINVLENVLVPL